MNNEDKIKLLEEENETTYKNTTKRIKKIIFIFF